MKKGDRVRLPNHSDFGEGTIKQIHFSPLSSKPYMVTVTLDKKAPSAFIYDSYDVPMFIGDVEVI